MNDLDTLFKEDFIPELKVKKEVENKVKNITRIDTNITDNHKYEIAKEIGLIQYNLFLLDLQTLETEERNRKLQYHWDNFKSILNVSLTHSELQSSKYMPLIFAYQELFNFKGGEIPRLEGIDINSNTDGIENGIIQYLKMMK